MLYQGRVLLVVPPETSSLELGRLQNGLRASLGVRIITQVGTIGGGSTLVLSVEKPLPLIQRLIEMPNVESAMEATDTAAILRPFWRKSDERRQPPVIRVGLKNASGPPADD